MKSDPSQPHRAAAAKRLAHLGGLAARTDAAERRILDAAEDRLRIVRAELDQLRPRALADDAAAERYQALTLESGQLDTVIANARAVLR